MQHFSVFKWLSLKWIKGTLKAQKLWSNRVALSSKLSHDNEITVDSSSASTACNTFWWEILSYLYMLSKPLSLTITPHCYGKKKIAWKASKTRIKKYLAMSHVMICDGTWNQNRGRTILHWRYLWNYGIQVKQPVTGCCKNSYMLPQEYSLLLLN